MPAVFTDQAASLVFDRTQANASLRVVPILGPSQPLPEYSLLEGQALQSVAITEVSREGRVPDLRVDNPMDRCIYLMDGQELVGAKQNRILNTDVLVPPRSSLTVPVSCVEQGRWRSVSLKFAPGDAASSTIRAQKASRVHASLRRSGHFDADQRAIWSEVHSSMQRSRAASPTGALRDAYLHRRKALDGFRSELHLPDDAVGVAVCRGPRLLGLDVFDKHTTLVHHWQRLLDGYALDWLVDAEGPGSRDLRAPPGGPDPAVAAVLRRAIAGTWEEFPSPGMGRDHRLQDDEWAGSALVWEGRVAVHLQVFPRRG